jgi:hypothetical protein
MDGTADQSPLVHLDLNRLNLYGDSAQVVGSSGNACYHLFTWTGPDDVSNRFNQDNVLFWAVSLAPVMDLFLYRQPSVTAPIISYMDPLSPSCTRW